MKGISVSFCAGHSLCFNCLQTLGDLLYINIIILLTDKFIYYTALYSETFGFAAHGGLGGHQEI